MHPEDSRVSRADPALPWTPLALRSAARAMADGGGFAVTAMRALADPEVEMSVVVKAINAAPGIALRVLKVANSAYYGRSGQIDSVERAILTLGLDVVRAVASVACLDRGLAAPGRVALVSGPELMRHSLATAIAAKELAQRIDPERGCEIFMAGLLHDLGYLLLQRLAPGRRDPALLRLHGECAAQAFAEWNLPARLVAATRHHHDPVGAGAGDSWTAIVAAAESLAWQAGAGLAIEAELALSADAAAVAWPLPGLDPDDPEVRGIAQRLPEALAAVAGSLGA